jgi:hypothetical protein
MGYNIDFSNTTILDKAPGYMDHFIKEDFQSIHAIVICSASINLMQREQHAVL